VPSDPDPADFAQRLADEFDAYVAEHEIPEDEYPEAFARWIGAKSGGPPPRFEKLEPTLEADEQD
jgi:hypothetical protein